ncbi:MAG: Rne/Rng family ribonuclease [Verrucomicrobiaceae bacterium]|nr:Rne/Rng family ribonuclease [Verrucomicrobiaceae bacterium]
MLGRLRRSRRDQVSDKGYKIIINVEKIETRVAQLQDGQLEDYTIERSGDENIIGSIFKGRVKNIDPALKAMFVDIGKEKNAFLHFWDAIPAALDNGLEEVRRKKGGKKTPNRISSKDIPSIYPVGSEVLIQVSKGPIGNKGPRVTTNISLPGRYMVLMPLNDQFGISRRIDDPKERERLRKITEKMDVPEGMGVILRTVCQGQRARYLIRDLNMLLEQWYDIEEQRQQKKAPVQVFQEPDLIERTVRDFLTDEVAEVICDDDETVKRMTGLVGKVSRRSRKRVHHYTGGQPIFDKFNLEKQISNAFKRQVWLPCGGSIVIDETEALIAIDVNTGRNKGKKNADKMILETNLESANEVARQLRLRNIGGLIVVDFIDMKSRKDQMAVYRRMRERTDDDKAKIQVLQLSQLGLMEMTRQRLNESLSMSMYTACPNCEGNGRIKSVESISVELQRRISGLLQQSDEENNDLVITVHPEVMQRLKTVDGETLIELERRHCGRLTFRSDHVLQREEVKITCGLTGREIAS